MRTSVALLFLLCACSGHVPHQVERGIAYEVRDCEYGRLRANLFWYARCAEDGDSACVTAGFAPGCWKDYAIEVERGDTHWIGGP
jgi:hypothetical protein